MIVAVLVVLAAIVVIAAIAVMVLRARPEDGVEQFQRQIDALSPEARRPVVDQVQQLDDGERQRDEEPGDEPPADGPGGNVPRGS